MVNNKEDIDYSKTIIYKITCDDSDVEDLYVGHTTDFYLRCCSHKSRCNKPTNKCYHYKW